MKFQNEDVLGHQPENEDLMATDEIKPCVFSALIEFVAGKHFIKKDMGSGWNENGLAKEIVWFYIVDSNSGY